MAKQKDEWKELAVVDHTKELAAVGLDTGLSVAGLEGDGPQVSRLTMFNDTAEEKEMYGSHVWGTYIDTLSNEALGEKVQILPIDAWGSWAKWTQGSKAPEYSTKNKADVPPKDLEWDGDRAPAATQIINVIVLVVGREWPYLFQFKRTGLKAFTKVIAPMEARRGSLRHGPGLYELSSEKDKSADGKPYKRVTARYVGNPPAELIATAITIKSAIASVKARAEAVADAAHNASTEGDDIPI